MLGIAMPVNALTMMGAKLWIRVRPVVIVAIIRKN